MSLLRRAVSQLSQRGVRMPASSATPQWIGDRLRSDAGVTVSAASALSISTVQACVTLISRSLASVPLVLYRRAADGGRVPAEEHPLYSLLHDVANPAQTAFDVRQQLFAAALIYGNGYAEIEWSSDGYPTALWPLAPEQVTPWISIDRRLIYQVHGDTYGVDARVRWLSDRQIHHVRGLVVQGLIGLSPLRAANAVGLALATEEFGARFFAQGAKPGYVLGHPATLSDRAYDRLTASWDSGGGENAHRTKILEEGMTIQKTGVAPDEAQFLETRSFQVLELCRIFGVSPGLVGAAETQTYASAEQDLIRLRELTLGPWARNHEAALQRDLLLPEERSEFFVEYRLGALQMTDLKTRYESYQIGLQNGFYTPNEVRAAEHLNPVPGGDALWRPLNMTTTDEPATAEDGDDDNRALLQAWIADVRARLENRIANDVRQIGAKHIRSGGRDALVGWGESMQCEWRQAGQSMLCALQRAHPQVEPDVAAWVSTAYQRAVGELING